MSSLDALAGVLRLRPGQARPRSVENRRPDWAAVLVSGRRAAEVPELLASLYTLCGHAHRLCAGLALGAAAGRETAPLQSAGEAARGLQRETLGEHLRRIALDWPQRLVPSDARKTLAAEALQALAECPALREPHAPVAATQRWLEQRLLGMPAEAWLAGWEGCPDWWQEWSRSGAGWLARLAWQARPMAAWPLVPAAPLHVHASAASLRGLADSLRADPGFTRQPRWQGDCAETGSWTRLHEAGRLPPVTPWHRLGARVAELVRLSLPDAALRTGASWLDFGALPVAVGEGLAWVEMARGLLVHHARLDLACGEPRVAAYQVLAPTEWNFHAEGAVARALEAMHVLCDERNGQVLHLRSEALMAAYDPCVRFEVEQPPQQECVHA